jgi:hypothetical protein
MWVFLQNCPQDYKDNTEVAIPMAFQDIASSRECVGENTKSPLKTRPASPTCVSQITAGGKAKVSWGKNRINTFAVNSNLFVGHTRESAHGKIKKFDATSQPNDLPIPSKGQTKARRG